MAGMFDDLIPSDGARSASKQPGMFDDLVPQRQAPGLLGRVKDAVRSFEAGGDRGISGLLGLPADAAQLVVAGKDYADAFIAGRPYNDLKAERDAKALVRPEQFERFGSAAVGRSLDAARGPEYKPQTQLGEYARTVGEFLPNAAGGGLSAGARAARVVIPGVASEAAGQVTQGTAAEPWARAGVGIATGLGVNAATRPGTAAGTIARAAGDLAPAERQVALGRYDELMAAARENNIPLSPAFAWDAATNGASDMASLYRHAEAMGRMRGFNAQMPGAVDQAARARFEAVAPVDSAPTLLGERVSEAAQQALDTSPTGRNVEAALQATGPRVTPDQAGQVIQRELRGVVDAREAARSQQAARDYSIAREAPERIGIERTVTVERPGPPVLQTLDNGEVRPLGYEPPPQGPSTLASTAPTRPDAPVQAGARGPSLARYIAENGGIGLERGDIKAAGLDRFRQPGVSNLVREDGLSIDNYWRTRLIEQGYLPPDTAGAGMQRNVHDEIVNLLEEEARGRRTYPYDYLGRDDATGFGQARDEFAAASSQAQNDLRRALTEAGIDPRSADPGALDRAAAALVRGETNDPLSAFESVVMAAREPASRGPASRLVPTTVTEEISAPRFGQANPQAALDAISRQVRTAKGDVRSELERVRRDFLEYGTDPVSGVRETDLSVEGLLHARERLDFRLSEAQRVGDATKVRDLQTVRAALDEQLKGVPEVALADANFAANSRPLEPFTGNAPLARVTQQDPLTGRMATPTEQVPSHLQGASATREFLANATPEARQALEGRVTTQILDQARGFDGRVSVDRLRSAMRESEDVLSQVPEVRERLGRVVDAQAARDRLNGTLVGKLAARDRTTAQAIDTLFPRGGDLLPNGEREIGAAVAALVRQNPEAARQLVRAKLESVFNSATKDLQGGANQMGGARYRAQLVGNPQEAANIAAAARALPNGDTLADGFGRFLDVLNASGRRQNVGSRTAYNEEFLREARDGSRGEEALRLAAGGFVKLPAKVQERLERWRLGRNVDELARLFSDPDAVTAFRGLIATGDRGGNIAGPVARLTAIASHSSTQPRESR